MNFEELESAVLDWASDRMILQNSNASTQLLKTMSELGELADAILKGSKPHVRDGVGDVLVTLAIVARLSNLDLRECLEQAYLEIKDRRGTLRPNGVFVKEEQTCGT